MELHNILIFVHILLLVFWLGTDIGVFVLGKFAVNPEYPVDQRLLLLKVALVLDMFPRVCVVLIIPTGFQLAHNLDLLPKLAFLMPAIWTVSLSWLGVVITGLANKENPIALKTRQIEKYFLFSLATVLTGGGLYSLVSGAFVDVKWLAAKIFLYGLIAIFMILLERAFIPALQKFGELETSGTTSDLEEKLTKAMDRTYIWVLAIYGAVIFSTFLGVVKPW